MTNYGSVTDVRSIGNYFGKNQEWGTIDEVRIYEEALSSAQIEKIFVQGLEKHQDLVRN